MQPQYYPTDPTQNYVTPEDARRWQEAMQRSGQIPIATQVVGGCPQPRPHARAAMFTQDVPPVQPTYSYQPARRFFPGRSLVVGAIVATIVTAGGGVAVGIHAQQGYRAVEIANLRQQNAEAEAQLSQLRNGVANVCAQLPNGYEAPGHQQPQ